MQQPFEKLQRTGSLKDGSNSSMWQIPEKVIGNLYSDIASSFDARKTFSHTFFTRYKDKNLKLLLRSIQDPKSSDVFEFEIKIYDDGPLGLKWSLTKTLGVDEDEELTHHALSSALLEKSEFTIDEWNAFRITNLNSNHYIRTKFKDIYKPDNVYFHWINTYFWSGDWFKTHLKFICLFHVRGANDVAHKFQDFVHELE